MGRPRGSKQVPSATGAAPKALVEASFPNNAIATHLKLSLGTVGTLAAPFRR